MEKQIRTNVHIEDAVNVTAKLVDFEGDLQGWKNAIYDLFRLNLTWSFAYNIDVYESAKCGVFVRLVIKPAFKENAVSTMNDWGFRNITTYHDNVGVVDCTDPPDDLYLDYIIID